MKPKQKGLIGKELTAVNVGIPNFADDLESQGVRVVRTNWSPPAGGDEQMLKILDELGS